MERKENTVSNRKSFTIQGNPPFTVKDSSETPIFVAWFQLDVWFEYNLQAVEIAILNYRLKIYEHIRGYIKNLFWNQEFELICTTTWKNWTLLLQTIWCVY